MRIRGRMACPLIIPPLAPVASPVAAYLSQLTTPSARTQRGGLRSVVGVLSGLASEPERYPWHRLDHATMTALRAELLRRYAPRTAKRFLCAVTAVLAHARRMGLMTRDAFRDAVDVPAIRRPTSTTGRALESFELSRLFSSCPSTIAGRRDAALLALLYGAGLRGCEVRRLTVHAITRGDVLALDIDGKGGKPRRVYLHGGARAAVLAWLDVRGSSPGPVIVGVTRHGRPRSGALSSHGVRHVMAAILDRSGVAHATPHDLRRTWIGDLLDAHADLCVVARLAGHSSVTTTQGYDRRPERVAIRAAGLIAVPYGP